jgi:SAM-dependent methyltransferase
MCNEPQSSACSSSHQTYDPAFFAQLARIEDTHFWFRARNEVIGTLLKQVAPASQNGFKVLEVGCGTGNVLRLLERILPGATIVGMDLFDNGLRFARQRTSASFLVQADLERLPFAASFDLVGAFDVLEHFRDDLAILRLLQSTLRPGGTLFLTVPAHSYLWSYFDRAAHHWRRYNLAELNQKLMDAGFEVKYSSYFMSVIFPLVWMGRRVSNATGNAVSTNRDFAIAQRELQVVPIINQVLTLALMQEARFIRRHWRLPFGTSLFAIAKKPAE